MKKILKKSLAVLLIAVLVVSGSVISLGASAETYTPNEFHKALFTEVSGKETVNENVYNALYEGMRDGAERITLDEGTYSVTEISDAFLIVKNDHPEIYWVGTGYTYATLGGYVCYVEPKYNSLLNNASAKAKFDAAVEDWLAGVGGTDREIALKLHDRFASNIEYEEVANAHDAYGALVNKVAVCEGFARAYQYLLTLCGVECTTVNGTSRDEGHAWNLVKFGSSWTWIDTTWDQSDDIIYHFYFASPDSYFLVDHTIADLPYSLPACTDDTLGWFDETNTFDTLSVTTISNMLVANKKGDVANVEFVYTGSDNVGSWLYDNALTFLEDCDLYGQAGLSYSQNGLEYHAKFYLKGAKDIITVGDYDDSEYFEIADGETLPVKTKLGTKYIVNWYDRSGTAITTYTDGVKPFADYVETGMLGVRMQFLKATDGTVSMRVISSVDRADKYSQTGWTMSLSDTTPEIGESGVSSRQSYHVYTGLLANGKRITPYNAFKSGGYGEWAKYLFIFEITGIPVAAQGSPIYIRPYVVHNDGTVIYGETKTITITDYVKIKTGDNEYYDNDKVAETSVPGAQ